MAEQQKQPGAAMEIRSLCRRLPNTKGEMPYWREMSRVRSGWDGGRLGCTTEDLRMLQLVEMVYRAIPGVGEGGLSGCEGEGGAIWLEAEDQRVVWGRVHKTKEFAGSGGSTMYWKAWAMLLSEGRVEGHLGKGPRDGGCTLGREKMAC